VIGGERQLIAAAGRGAVDDGDEALAGILGRVFQTVAGLIGEFAEVDLVRGLFSPAAADIGAAEGTPGFASAPARL
jgi:hypothetical protein